MRTDLKAEDWGRGDDEKGAWSDDHIIPVTAFGRTEEDQLSRCIDVAIYSAIFACGEDIDISKIFASFWRRCDADVHIYCTWTSTYCTVLSDDNPWKIPEVMVR